MSCSDELGRSSLTVTGTQKRGGQRAFPAAPSPPATQPEALVTSLAPVVLLLSAHHGVIPWCCRCRLTQAEKIIHMPGRTRCMQVNLALQGSPSYFPRQLRGP